MPIFDQLERYDGAVALITENGEITYKELIEKADMVGGFLAERSLAFCVCSNRMGAVIGYVGMLRKRVVPVMVNFAIDKDLFAQLFNIYRPQFIWQPADFESEGGTLFHMDGYELKKTGFSDLPKMADDLALLLTTSGSTGSPKLVRQTYENINANTVSIMEYLGIEQSERAITTLPMNYTYGLSIIQSHLYAGASIVLTEKSFMQREFWNLFRKSEATSFGGVPYTYEMLKRLHFLQMDLPSLHYITQAGGKLERDLHLEFAEGMRKMGKRFIVMYGATEATARMAYVPAEFAVEKAGSIGIAIPGGRLELQDESGTQITQSGIVGELIYYGPNVTLGYAESREDLANGDERHGRLETGDMAMRDADGFFYVVGRKNRFLKIYGNRVNLMEVEQILKKNGFEAVCVGKDDHMRIYTTNRETERLRDYIAEKTRINRTAFTVIRIDAIPRSESGKVLYSELQ